MKAMFDDDSGWMVVNYGIIIFARLDSIPAKYHSDSEGRMKCILH